MPKICFDIIQGYNLTRKFGNFFAVFIYDTQLDMILEKTAVCVGAIDPLWEHSIIFDYDNNYPTAIVKIYEKTDTEREIAEFVIDISEQKSKVFDVKNVSGGILKVRIGTTGNKYISTALDILKDTDKIADSAYDKLVEQGNKIDKIGKNVEKIDTIMEKSSRVVRSMSSFFGSIFNKFTNEPEVIDKYEPIPVNYIDQGGEEELDELDDICKILDGLKQKSVKIGNEVKMHNKKLDLLSTDIERVDNKTRKQTLNVKKLIV